MHQHRLRLVLLADDLDDLVEVEIGDEIAAEHFEPMLDLARAGSANGAAARRGDASSHSLSASASPTTFGIAAAHQHVHVERHAAFQLGELEQALHHQRRIDAARARLEHEAHILGEFVAHVGDQRQLLLVDQLGDASRPAASSAPARGSR